MNVNALIPTVDWRALAPFTIVVSTGIVALIIEMLRPRRNNNLVVGVSLVGLLVAGWSLFGMLGRTSGESFAGMVLNDRFGQILQLVMVGSCAVCFLFSEPYLREKRIPFAEFYPLALWSTAGGMLMVSSKHLLMVFLGLELLSISLYCLAGMSRYESKSEESALKYFLLGSFASAFLLMGIAFIYGETASLHLGRISEVLGAASASPLSTIGAAMVLVGLGFKLALVPFHQWTPDVYQGAPTNVTAFMAAVSKVAALGALVRFLWAIGTLDTVWFPLMWWVAVATMTVGNLAALVQNDVKRTLGYSSIAHAGYLLVGVLAAFSAPGRVSLDATAFYLISYAAMTIGAFAVISLTASGQHEGTRFYDVRGLWKRAPWAAGCLVVFLCSLIGIPITSGFFGKLLIFQAAFDAGLPTLAVLLAVNSAISAYYYLGIIQAAFVTEEGAVAPRLGKPSASLNLACAVCLAGVLGAGLFAGPLIQGMGTAEVGPPVGVPVQDPLTIHTQNTSD